MNKKEASDYLGISTRQLENYAKQGKLSVRYERGRTGDVAVYDEQELRRLKAELSQKHAPRAAVVRDEPESEPSSESLALVRGSASDVSRLSPVEQLIVATLDDSNKERARRARQKLNNVVKMMNPTPISEKILLSVDECSTLTGLSDGFLRDAIHAKRLKAKIIGRGYKVKRADLDLFVSKL